MSGEKTTLRERGRRRDEILEAALRVLARSGYDGLSLQAVADSVGIRKASLLYHFKSKAALRTAVLEQMLTRWNEVLPRVLRAATAGPEQLHAVLRETMAFFSSDPDRARVLLREGLDRPEEFRELIAGHVRPWAEIACTHIESGRAKARVHASVDPAAYVAVLVNAMVSLVATAPYMSAFVSTEPDLATARLEAEFLRFAHAALFVPRKDPGVDSGVALATAYADVAQGGTSPPPAAPTLIVAPGSHPAKARRKTTTANAAKTASSANTKATRPSTRTV